MRWCIVVGWMGYEWWGPHTIFDGWNWWLGIDNRRIFVFLVWQFITAYTECLTAIVWIICATGTTIILKNRKSLEKDCRALHHSLSAIIDFRLTMATCKYLRIILAEHPWIERRQIRNLLEVRVAVFEWHTLPEIRLRCDACATFAKGIAPRSDRWVAQITGHKVYMAFDTRF